MRSIQNSIYIFIALIIRKFIFSKKRLYFFRKRSLPTIFDTQYRTFPFCLHREVREDCNSTIFESDLVLFVLFKALLVLNYNKGINLLSKNCTKKKDTQT